MDDTDGAMGGAVAPRSTAELRHWQPAGSGDPARPAWQGPWPCPSHFVTGFEIRGFELEREPTQSHSPVSLASPICQCHSLLPPLRRTRLAPEQRHPPLFGVSLGSPRFASPPQLQRWAVITHSDPHMPPALQLVRMLLTR